MTGVMQDGACCKLTARPTAVSYTRYMPIYVSLLTAGFKQLINSNINACWNNLGYKIKWWCLIHKVKFLRWNWILMYMDYNPFIEYLGTMMIAFILLMFICIMNFAMWETPFNNLRLLIIDIIATAPALQSWRLWRETGCWFVVEITIHCMSSFKQEFLSS